LHAISAVISNEDGCWESNASPLKKTKSGAVKVYLYVPDLMSLSQN
jgi:hypothetical protein